MAQLLLHFLGAGRRFGNFSAQQVAVALAQPMNDHPQRGSVTTNLREAFGVRGV